MTTGSLMKVKSIAECSLWSILQYFWPALSDNWSCKPIFGLFDSGCYTQVLLYIQISPALPIYYKSNKYHMITPHVYSEEEENKHIVSDQTAPLRSLIRLPL